MNSAFLVALKYPQFYSFASSLECLTAGWSCQCQLNVIPVVQPACIMRASGSSVAAVLIKTLASCLKAVNAFPATQWAVLAVYDPRYAATVATRLAAALTALSRVG